MSVRNSKLADTSNALSATLVTSIRRQKDLKKPTSPVAVVEEPIIATMKSPPQKEAPTNEAPAINLSSNSFRADDILRSKLSSETAQPLPLIQPTAPRFSQEKETPMARSPSFPQIRPPAFCPVVNTKHITPFEHAEKPMFRARQASAPAARLESKPRRSPSPSPPNVTDEQQKKPEQKNQNSTSKTSLLPSNYSWNSWERPSFNRISGVLPVPDDPLLIEPRPISYLRSGTNAESLFSFPHDPDYKTHNRYSTTGTHRHRSKKHRHQLKSVGNYSTYNQKSSGSYPSIRAPDLPYPTLDPAYREDILQQQQQPLFIPQVMQTRPPVIPQSPKPVQLRQNYRNEVITRPNEKRRLISSGTDDTPIQLVENIGTTRQPNQIPPPMPASATYLETITPVFIPQTVVANQPNQNPIKPPGEPIRYTSDVVRSMNRQAFKMGHRGVGDEPFSPKDQYLAAINNGTTKSPSREREGYVSGRPNGSERRQSVRDLAKKFSLQSDEDVFVRRPRDELNRANSEDRSYLEEGIYPFRR